MSNNSLENLPGTFESLKSLRKLNASHNLLRNCPRVAGISGICHAHQLGYFVLILMLVSTLLNKEYAVCCVEYLSFTGPKRGCSSLRVDILPKYMNGRSLNDILYRKFQHTIQAKSIETTKRCRFSQKSVKCLHDDSSWAPCS